MVAVLSKALPIRPGSTEAYEDTEECANKHPQGVWNQGEHTQATLIEQATEKKGSRIRDELL